MLPESHSAPLLEQQVNIAQESQSRSSSAPADWPSLSAEDNRLLMLIGITPEQLAASGKTLEHIKQFGLDVELG